MEFIYCNKTMTKILFITNNLLVIFKFNDSTVCCVKHTNIIIILNTVPWGNVLSYTFCDKLHSEMVEHHYGNCGVGLGEISQQNCKQMVG
jgi:hypothetical protein